MDKKKQKQKMDNDKFKKDYFDYYDDVKTHTHRVIDW